jgi:hypothetical protein
MELEELGERIAELAAQISAATYELLAMLRDFDERGGWGGGFHSCAHWLCWRVGLDPGAHVERLVRGMRRVDRIAAGHSEKRLHAARYLRFYTDEDGMVVVKGRLAPEAGVALLRALDAGVEPLQEAPALPAPVGEPVTALVARLASHGVGVDAGATLPDWWGGERRARARRRR